MHEIPRQVPVAGGGVSASAQNEWALLVEKVQSDPRAGMADLYKRFQRGVAYLLAKELRQRADAEDGLMKILDMVLGAIQRGEIRDPNCLQSFTRTVARRYIAEQIRTGVRDRAREVDVALCGNVLIDPKSTPETAALGAERRDLMRQALAGLEARDREIIVRFYVDEQTREQIQEEMGLTADQFRNFKSRARKELSSVHIRRQRAAELEATKRRVAVAAYA